jgi:hypothetical protein
LPEKTGIVCDSDVCGDMLYYKYSDEGYACPANINFNSLNDSPRNDFNDVKEGSEVYFLNSVFYSSSMERVSVSSQREIYHHSVSFGVQSEVLGEAVALFDGGALNGNYIHPYIVQRYLNVLRPYIQPNEFSVF